MGNSYDDYDLKMGNSYDILSTYKITHDAMKNKNPVDEGSALAEIYLMDHADPDPEPIQDPTELIQDPTEDSNQASD